METGSAASVSTPTREHEERPRQLRVFVALRLAGEIQQALGAVQHDAGRARSAFRWVRPEGMHLTLAFLGNVDATRLAAISEATADAGAATDPVTLSVRGLGCFPSANRPRVLWAGLGGQVEALASLQERVETGLRAAGVALEERAFRPHVTLARARDALAPAQRQDLDALLRRTPARYGHWQASEVEGIRSQLNPEGSVYTTLFSALLGSG